MLSLSLKEISVCLAFILSAWPPLKDLRAMKQLVVLRHLPDGFYNKILKTFSDHNQSWRGSPQPKLEKISMY